MNILADAMLPGLVEAFPKPFTLTQYNNPEEIPGLLDNQDILLCRSTLKVNSTLLKDHHLKYVATASSGTDHLDYAFLTAQKIKIIDAKGCNAPSVADYVLACLAYLDILQLLKGKKAGIIGMGYVGSIVYERLKTSGFQIIQYDPPKAGQDHNFQNCSLEDLYQVDLLCIHAELQNNHQYSSVNLIDNHFIDQLKPDCVIINAARGGIVNEEALLNSSKPLVYCTDVYLNEPGIDKRIIDKATLCTPHIAGHSQEAKYKAVSIVSEKLHRFAKLPVPIFAKPKRPVTKELAAYKSWEDLILSIYNPDYETKQLKQAQDKKSAFINLRKSHQNRHDFDVYFDSTLDLEKAIENYCPT